MLYCNNSVLNFESLLDSRRCCTCTSTTARATSSPWPATTPRPTTGSSWPGRPPSSATGRAAGVRRRPTGAHRSAAARPAPGAAGGAEPAAYRPVRAHLGGRRRLQRLHVGGHPGTGDRARDPRRARRPVGLQAAPQDHDQPHARSVRCASGHRPPGGRGRPARTRRRPRAGPARRHPGGDAWLRRDGHRRVLGGPRLALPAHREADLPDRPARGPRAAPAAGAHQPLRRRHRRLRRGRADDASPRTPRARRAPARPGGDAAPLLRRPARRRQHGPFPRRRVRGGRAA